MRTALWLALAWTATACGGEPDTTGLVARAGDYELTVDDAVQLLVDQEELPAQRPVVRSLAELWVDYTLLAEAVADDSTFSDVDFDGLIQPVVEQMMVLQLRDSVVQVDTAITPDELEELYAAEAPEVELRARHILMTYPVQASEAQRDSVRARLEEIRGEIVSGRATFEDMARRFSQDRGTAASGGDLGSFGRGEMVAPFEEAVMALQPGEVSEVVQTPLGLHLIRLDSRRVRDFDEIAPDYRSYVQARRYAVAESTFIADLEGGSQPTVTDGALSVARELARTPDTRLTGPAARRALVEWDGGAFTAGELLDVLRSQQSGLRDQVQTGSDEDVTEFLLGQARRELLVQEAREAGLEPPAETLDSLRTQARSQLRAAARSIGLMDLDQAPGEARERAVARVVRSALVDNLTGATRIVPLGLVGYQLREGVPIAIYDNGIGQVLIQVAQIRAQRPPSALEESLGQPQEPADTTTR